MQASCTGSQKPVNLQFELGRLPLIVNIVCRVLKYYVDICKRETSLIVTITLKLHNMSDKSWFSFVNFIENSLEWNGLVQPYLPSGLV